MPAWQRSFFSAKASKEALGLNRLTEIISKFLGHYSGGPVLSIRVVLAVCVCRRREAVYGGRDGVLKCHHFGHAGIKIANRQGQRRCFVDAAVTAKGDF